MQSMVWYSDKRCSADLLFLLLTLLLVFFVVLGHWSNSYFWPV